MASLVVTITGSNSTIDTVSTGGPDVLNLANIIGNLLSSISGAGGLQVSAGSPQGIIPPPSPFTGQETLRELVLSGPEAINVTIPAGYQYVANIGAMPSTVTGNDVVVVSGQIGSSFTVAGQSTVAATGGNNTINASGNYVLSTGAGNNTISVTGSGTVATGVGQSTITVGAGANPAARNFVASEGTNDLIVSTSGLATINASGTGAGVLGGTGTITATLSGNAATLSAAQSDGLVTASGSNAVVFGGNVPGSGTLYLASTGNNNTIATYQSNATINSSGDNAAIFGGSGTSDITIAGTSSTLVGGSGNLNVSASSNTLVFGGTGSLAFVGGAGTSTIVGNTGATEQATVGSGGLVFAAENNNRSTIAGGPGGATMFGGAGSIVDYGGSLAGGLFVATSGNETLDAAGSSTANFFSGGSSATSNVLMVGGSGADTLLAGPGADTMAGGLGSNVFAFFATVTRGEQSYITDFTSDDSIYLIGYSSTQSAASLLTNATTANGVTVTLSDSTKITFTNLSSTTALDGRILYG